MPQTYRPSALFLPLLCSFAAGCGVETYQARVLENTVPLFHYERELDQNLGPEWNRGEVHLRLPAGLKEIPGPKKKDDPETRLPPELTTDIKGVLGGFRGKMDAAKANGENVKADFHVVVLSNRALIASPSPDAKPDRFDKTLVNTIVSSLGESPTGSTGLRRVEVGDSPHDRTDFGSMPPKVAYDMVQLDTTIGEVPMRYEVYIRRQPPLMVAIVFLVPRDPSRSERLRDKIDLSLQTLRITQPGAATGPSTPVAGGGGTSSGPGF